MPSPNSPEKRLRDKEYRERNKEALKIKRAARPREVKDSELKKNRDRYATSLEYNMWKSARNRAIKKNIPFSIEPEDIHIPSLCPYLEIPLFPGKGTQGPNSPSLDRIVPDLGYVKGNIQVISYRANSMKNDATESDLILFCINALKLHLN